MRLHATTLRRTIRQHVDHLMTLKVDDDRAVVGTLPPRPVVDASDTDDPYAVVENTTRSLAGLVADRGVDCCLMHMLGEPRTMQRDPRYDEVVADVRFFLEARTEFAIEHGIAEDRILLDPGIGFGKTVAHNLELLRRLDEIAQLGRPVVIGTSAVLKAPIQS